MADNADTASEPQQITFKVKTSGDKSHTITMSDAATVLDLKTKLSGDDFEKIPVERQRLIYSGRVLKNEETLGTYKIKPNNTIHMVKSAASNPGQPASTSASTSTPAVPTNMASGTANNPLAGLTGARYAGHQINLPGMDMFGPDGGMGPPMDEERIQRMMEDPNAQQSMNEALNNPDFVNMLIQSNPILRNMPNAREIITSPFMRQMISNPSMMAQAMRMQRGMRGGNSAFPAPGATDTTPSDAAASNDNAANSGANAQNPFANPFAAFGGYPGGQSGGFPDLTQLQALLGATRPPNAAAGDSAAAPASTGDGTSTSTTTAGQDSQQNTQQAAANPFAALFPPPGGSQENPFGMNPEMMQQIMQMMGGGGAAQASPPDNRPPEERYADQLRQLNDMGFFDFDRNVAALRRSGGSVQGAVEYLLGSS
ncbi:unnamed protein product [Clonostachys rosea f. rosea IK726]|uniref:Deubiquitination-protection protein dph1 n=2 Tax=Bionectria ochroleuca TaxID=29856 RepID=A0A0B7JXT6_BIOOC|nr:unnamed protein product [Clonostachys rosea f. rosea IK726]